MAEKMIKFRMFHYYIEEPVLGVAGQVGLVERQASFGEVVDIPREEDVQRGEYLHAFYTDKEMEAIENGTYRGTDAGALALRLGAGGATGFPTVPPFSPGEVQPADLATASSIRGMDADQVAQLIEDQDLDEEQTVQLAQGDPALAEIVMDAENMAGSPRSAVLSGLEAIPPSPGPTLEEAMQPGGLVPSLESGAEPAKNASKQEWVDYAQLQGVEFDEDDTRDDIIAKVQEAQGAQG